MFLIIHVECPVEREREKNHLTENIIQNFTQVILPIQETESECTLLIQWIYF